MISAITLTLAMFAMVYARAFQQLNVMHHKVWWVPPCSLVMAFAEAGIVLGIVEVGIWAAIWTAIGGASGCIAAMQTHRYLRSMYEDEP